VIVRPEARPSPASISVLSGHYVMLRADTLRLLLPQHEVGAAEHILGATLEPGDEAGLLRQADGPSARPFAALSAQMTLLPRCPPDRFVATALGEGGEGTDGIAWCWNEVQVLINVELQPRQLPAVLLAPHAPVEQYVEHAGEIVYLCSARRLREFALGQRN
jgi:hypothetical protein